ncbi:MAG: leucine-rich repeat domain-containing protein [Clostridia bacterium]|nr:leucine-rich repeat domain-containing protein [Clostridia bacterium]
MNRHKILVFITTVAILSTSIMPVNCYASEMDEEEFATEDVFGICDGRDYIPEVWAYAVEPYPEEEYDSDCPPASFDGDTGEYKEYESMGDYISENGPFPRNQGSMTIVIHNEEEKEIANEIFESNSTIVDKAKALESNGFDISCDVSYGNNTFKHEDDLEESLKYDEPVGQRAIPVEETDGDYDDIEYEEAKGNNSDVSSNNEKSNVTTNKENISYDENSGVYNGCTWNYNPNEKKLYIKSDSDAVINYTKDGSDFPWYVNKDEITKISIEGTSRIEAHAFDAYTNLERIYINSSITYITSYAFPKNSSFELYINGNPEVNENFFTNLDPNITIKCHYDPSVNSIYSNCVKYGRNFTTIENINAVAMEQVENIYQMDEHITSISDGRVSWNNGACITCSCALMIERYAANNNYQGDYTFAGINGDYKTGAVALVEDITKNHNDGYGTGSDWAFHWYETKPYYEYTKNNQPLTLKGNLISGGSEADLKQALSTHPEGVLTYIESTDANGIKHNHGVLVIGYDSKSKTYTILDPGKKYESPYGTGVNGKYQVTFDYLANNGKTDKLKRIYTVTGTL